MKQDAFSAGVEPGGLWHKNDIRILLCYILASVGAPLSRGDLTRMIQEKGLANYFEVEDALAALAKQGNILLQEDGACAVTETGREIARSLDTTLPLSVRDKALEAAVSLLAQARAQRENQVELQETDRGWQVKCHISGGDMELMSITLYVPDRAQAECVRDRFHRDPEGVYRLLLAALTGDRALSRELFEERESRL